MKSLRLIGLAFVAVLIMSGCGARTPAPYIEEYVSKNVDLNKNQIDDKIVVTKHEPVIIPRKPRTFKGSKYTVDMETSAIGDNVTKKFMEQFFTQVSIGGDASSAFMEVDIKILDYSYQLHTYTEGVYMDVKIEANVKKNGKLILSKVYAEDVGNNNFMSFTFLKGDFNLQNQVVETFHKGVLTVLDKKIKPDLLKALKENP